MSLRRKKYNIVFAVMLFNCLGVVELAIGQFSIRMTSFTRIHYTSVKANARELPHRGCTVSVAEKKEKGIIATPLVWPGADPVGGRPPPIFGKVNFIFLHCIQCLKNILEI